MYEEKMRQRKRPKNRKEMRQVGNPELIERKRRRRRKRKLLRALVLAILVTLFLGICTGLYFLGRFLFHAVERGEFVFPWEDAKTVIMLDAGHGGKDPGANNGAVLEKDITLEIAKLVKEQLQEGGWRVRMTRTDDSYMDIRDRAAYANQKQADLFVSIHCNSLEEGQASGIETYYAEAKEETSQSLAQAIQTELIAFTGAVDRGVKTTNYTVLVRTDMPAALVEVGFLSDEGERTLLQQEEYLKKLAQGIAGGIEQELSASGET